MPNQTVANASESPTPPAESRWYHRIGPGLITACVVIGPGSLLASSQVGAKDGYSRAWVVVVAGFFMLVYITLAAKLGMVASESPATVIRRHAGRPLAILIGFAVFFIASAFQFGNNLGVQSALSAYVAFDYCVILFNAIAILFLFGFRGLYQKIERVMMCLVAIMLISFAINLAFAKPDVGAMAKGMISIREVADVGLPVLALIGTTFISAAAFYQAYLVQYRGWREADLRRGLVDARIGAVIMAVITLMVMFTAAAVLRGKDLGSVGDVADSLRPAFGEMGRAVFCTGLFAAAFSSFIVNAMVGGTVLSDALNLGSKPDQLAPRVLATVVLLIGMAVALYVIKTGLRPVPAIVVGQAVTVIASPLTAGVLLWLTNHPGVMGAHRNGAVMNIAAGAGLILVVAMALYLAYETVWPAIQNSMLN